MGATAEEIADRERAVEDWVSFSSENHPYEQVREKAILDSMLNNKAYCTTEQMEMIKDYNSTLICYSYLSQHQIFTEEQIEEIMVITSPLFPLMGFSLQDSKSVETTLRILAVGPDSEEQKKEILNILEEHSEEKLDKVYSTFLSKLRNITKKSSIPKQGITDKLDWRSIDKYQSLSSEFREKWKALLKPREAQPHYKEYAHSSSNIKGSSIVKARPTRARKSVKL